MKQPPSGPVAGQTALVVTSHFHAPNWRKTGMHLLAEAMVERGCPTTIVTVGQSYLKQRLNPRIASLVTATRTNTRSPVGAHVARELVHPPSGHSNLVTTLTHPLVVLYGRRPDREFASLARGATYILLEAGYSFFYFDALRRLAPSAVIAGLLNDDLDLVGFRPDVIRHCMAVLPKLDFVRTNAEALLEKLPPKTGGVFISSGLDKTAFADPGPSPYRSGIRNIVSIGNMLFDRATMMAMARHRPDVHFHLIGIPPDDALPDNVEAYGEMPFARTIPFMAHADVGLAPYRLSPGMGYLGQSSLKLLQYAHCGLPILVPVAAAPSRSNVFAYDPQNLESVTSMLDRALEAGRGDPDDSIPDWSDVADQLMSAMDRAARDRRRSRAA